MLRLEDYEVVACSGFEDTRQRMTEGLAPDLLITDVVLERSTGTRVAAMVRQIAPQVPVLYMSGYDNIVAGGSTERVLLKPFNCQELASAVTRLLREQATERRQRARAPQ